MLMPGRFAKVVFISTVWNICAVGPESVYPRKLFGLGWILKVLRMWSLVQNVRRQTCLDLLEASAKLEVVRSLD